MTQTMNETGKWATAVGYAFPGGIFFGAGGRDRTDTFVRKQEFESCASTNSATPAYHMQGILNPINSGQVNGLAPCLARRPRRERIVKVGCAQGGAA